MTELALFELRWRSASFLGNKRAPQFRERVITRAFVAFTRDTRAFIESSLRVHWRIFQRLAWFRYCPDTIRMIEKNVFALTDDGIPRMRSLHVTIRVLQQIREYNSRSHPSSPPGWKRRLEIFHWIFREKKARHASRRDSRRFSGLKGHRRLSERR